MADAATTTSAMPSPTPKRLDASLTLPPQPSIRTPLLEPEPDLELAKATNSSAYTTDVDASGTSPRASRIDRVVVVALEIVLDAALCGMVEYLHGPLERKVLAVFSVVGIMQQMLVASLYASLERSFDSTKLSPRRRGERWIYLQAATIVYYVWCVPITAGSMLFAASFFKLGEETETAVVVANLLSVILIGVPQSTACLAIKGALRHRGTLRPYTIASVTALCVSLPVAYVLGVWTSLDYVGLACGYVLHFGLLSTLLLRHLRQAEGLQGMWTGWQLHAAVKRVLTMSRNDMPNAPSILAVLCHSTAFAFVSLLASVLPRDNDVLPANDNLTGSVLLLVFAPLLGVYSWAGERVMTKTTLVLSEPTAEDPKARRSRAAVRIVIALFTCFISVCWFLAGPYAAADVTTATASTAKSIVHALLQAIPIIGFVVGVRLVLLLCATSWQRSRAHFMAVFVVGIPLGYVFALKLDAGLLGLWYGPFLGTTAFVVANAWCN